MTRENYTAAATITTTTTIISTTTTTTNNKNNNNNNNYKWASQSTENELNNIPLTKWVPCFHKVHFGCLETDMV